MYYLYVFVAFFFFEVLLAVVSDMSKKTAWATLSGQNGYEITKIYIVYHCDKRDYLQSLAGPVFFSGIPW